MFPTCVAKPRARGGQVPPRGARLPSPSAAGGAGARWGQGRNLPASQNGLPEKKKPLEENMCMVGNGLLRVCLVWFFFTRADFLAKIHDGNNERKEGAGEPCCKPDFHV